MYLKNIRTFSYLERVRSRKPFWELVRLSGHLKYFILIKIFMNRTKRASADNDIESDLSKENSYHFLLLKHQTGLSKKGLGHAYLTTLCHAAKIHTKDQMKNRIAVRIKNWWTLKNFFIEKKLIATR